MYGDVGTSPLYVFSSTFTENTPSETDVLGAMSIIFWTITLIVVVKYMLIVLLADDNGEGGHCLEVCCCDGLRKLVRKSVHACNCLDMCSNSAVLSLCKCEVMQLLTSFCDRSMWG